ncbi:MAG: cytochrome c3 family protein, partial [Gemmatimonadales bacterium]
IAPLVAVLGLALGACTDDEVFVERPAFDQPTDEVNRFLGYVGDPADKLPNCGNCHATFLGQWRGHGHSDAWAGLQSSDHAAAFCEGCHTVSENGNPAEGDAGWVATQDERYLDVQCESCHGSGWEHVNDPAVETAPLCSVLADEAATTGCGECHAGTHHPFVEQWKLSAHGNTSSYARGRADCQECHEGRVALEQKFAEQGNYLEKDGAETQSIFCVVCHDSHGSEYEAHLRAPIDVASPDHLCIRCHSNRGTPPSDHGAHGAQGLLLLQDDIGWIPGGFEGPEPPAHGNIAINEELCITCHVVHFEVTDPASGDHVFTSVGHTFEAIPCLDAEGIPEAPGTDCLLTERDFRTCAGCHNSETEARNLFVENRDSINVLLDLLWVDDDANGAMDATDSGLLPQVLALSPTDTTELDPRDQKVTVAEGVFWNAQIAHTSEREYFAGALFYVGLAGDDEDDPPDGIPDGIEWDTHEASGDGVHNPDFLKQLLEASIEALIDTYGLTP